MAHNLLANGQADQAARIFAELARLAETLGRPDRAARLHLQAARSWLEAQAIPLALEHAGAALRSLVDAGRPGQAAQVFARIQQALLAQGRQAEAGQFRRQWPNLAAGVQGPGVAQATARPTLPAKCPLCGGPVRSDEVEWIDGTTAECPFCGGVLAAA